MPGGHFVWLKGRRILFGVKQRTRLSLAEATTLDYFCAHKMLACHHHSLHIQAKMFNNLIANNKCKQKVLGKLNLNKTNLGPEIMKSGQGGWCTSV